MTWPQPDRPVGYYVDHEGMPFHVVEVDMFSAPDRIAAAGQGIAQVLRASWQKFVPDVLQQADLDELPTPERMVSRILHKPEGVRYVVAVNGASDLVSPDQVQAFGRVRQYRPRRPAVRNLTMRPYPDVTDLETRDGGLGIVRGDRYGVQAAAVLRHMLDSEHIDTPTNPNRKVSAYTERPNLQGITFYEQFGFVEDVRIKPEAITQQVGSSALEMVHMAASQAGEPQEALRQFLYMYE